VRLIPVLGDQPNFKRVSAMLQRSQAMWPASRKFGEIVSREAARRAPRGRSRRQVSLSARFGHVEPQHDTTVLTNDAPYARIQAFGGTITPGGGKLHAKMLALPLNDTAERMLDGLGAGQSLRTLGLEIFESRNGRVFLVRKLDTAATAKKRGRAVRGAKREHRIGNIQFLFLLRYGVTMPPNAKQFVPRFEEPELRSRAAEIVRKWITEGLV